MSAIDIYQITLLEDKSANSTLFKWASLFSSDQSNQSNQKSSIFDYSNIKVSWFEPQN
jgi:hypothetical protein